MLIGLQHVVSGVPFWAPGPHSREDSSPETQTTQGSAQFSALLPIFIETQCLASSRPQGRVLAAGGPRGWETPCLGADLSRCVPPLPQVFLPKYRGDDGGGAGEDGVMTSFLPGPKAPAPFPKAPAPFPHGHGGPGGLLAAPPALCGASACDGSVRAVVAEPQEARAVPGRGICLDLAILDSAFLLSQVAPSLFMGFIVQLSQSVTAYMVSAAGLGLVAIYFVTQVVFDKNDLAKYSV